MLLFTACTEPECVDCYTLPEDTAGDTATDTGEPVDTDDDYTTGWCAGTYVDTTGGAIAGICADCSDFSCGWIVVADAARAELEAKAVLEVDDAYAEYHDAFGAGAASTRPALRITLEVTDDPVDYVSNATTHATTTDPELWSAFTFQVSIADDEGVYTDCYVWGADPASFGGWCRE